jgi:hypothetical protein
MSALARDIDRKAPAIPSLRDGDAARDAWPLILAQRFVHADVPVPTNAGFEDPRASPIRGNLPRRRPPVTDRQLLRLIAVVGLLIIVSHEMRYSTLQAELWSRVAQPLGFHLAAGADPSPITPDRGPYDLRLGYANLPTNVARLRNGGFEVVSQARPSAQMRALSERGLDVIYPEKARAGLTLFDGGGRVIYTARYPHFIYDRFEAIPRWWWRACCSSKTVSCLTAAGHATR